jgi:hypothetical protein
MVTETNGKCIHIKVGDDYYVCEEYYIAPVNKKDPGEKGINVFSDDGLGTFVCRINVPNLPVESSNTYHEDLMNIIKNLKESLDKLNGVHDDKNIQTPTIVISKEQLTHLKLTILNNFLDPYGNARPEEKIIYLKRVYEYVLTSKNELDVLLPPPDEIVTSVPTMKRDMVTQYLYDHRKDTLMDPDNLEEIIMEGLKGLETLTNKELENEYLKAFNQKIKIIT